MKILVLSFIRLWQKIFLPFFNSLIFIPSQCKFNPSCSVYTYQSVESFGVFKGIFLSIKRLLKCQPFNI